MACVFSKTFRHGNQSAFPLPQHLRHEHGAAGDSFSLLVNCENRNARVFGRNRFRLEIISDPLIPMLSCLLALLCWSSSHLISN